MSISKETALGEAKDRKSGFEIEDRISTFFIPDSLTQVWGFRPNRLTITDLDSPWGEIIDVGPSWIKTSKGVDKTEQYTLLTKGSENNFSPVRRALIRLQDGNPPIISPDIRGNPKVKYFYAENAAIRAKQTERGTMIFMTGQVEEITTTSYSLWEPIQKILAAQAKQRASHYMTLYQR